MQAGYPRIRGDLPYAHVLRKSSELRGGRSHLSTEVASYLIGKRFQLALGGIAGVGDIACIEHHRGGASGHKEKRQKQIPAVARSKPIRRPHVAQFEQWPT